MWLHKQRWGTMCLYAFVCVAFLVRFFGTSGILGLVRKGKQAEGLSLSFRLCVYDIELFALRITRRGYLETRRLGGLVTHSKKKRKNLENRGTTASHRPAMLRDWGTTASHRPATLRAGALGKGRERDKSPSQGMGRKGFMNLSIEHLHALRLSASADLVFRVRLAHLGAWAAASGHISDSDIKNKTWNRFVE